MNRHIRALFGAPAPLRVGSQVAGTWTGVGVHSDYPCQQLNVQWPAGEYASGRVMLTRHFTSSIALQIGSIYGFPSSPTWPRHKQLTQSLLRALTTEMVVGSSGPRLIVGDMNTARDTPGEFDVWRRYGWVEAQHLAQTLWQQEPEWTCKGTTQIDHIWLSPEAACLCRTVGLVHLFADHRTLFVDLAVANHASSIRAWPCPSKIAWDSIDTEAWHSAFTPAPLPDHTSSGDFLDSWCHSWESSLDGFCRSSRDHKLPSHFKGRAHRRAPQHVDIAPPVAKASREGEVQLRCDFASTMLLRWFKQLRRLQAFSHAAMAAKDTVQAESYRLAVWLAIKKAPGFGPGFAQWWQTREHPTAAAPLHLPDAPPLGPVAQAIFDDFHLHFQKYEAWCLRQRFSLLKLKYNKTHKALFADLRDPARDQLDFLWHTEELTVLACDHDSGEIHLDKAPVLHPHSQLRWDSTILVPENLQDDLLRCSTLPASLEPGDSIRHEVILSSVDQVHEALASLWKPRWQKMAQLSADMWHRVTSFVQAYMPTCQFAAPIFDVPSWHATLKRFPAHAARGVDGIDIADLRALPDACTHQLMDFLQTLDGDSVPWPPQLMYGKVINLAKISGAHLASHFRPVVIFGTIYRAWSRHCARPILKKLAGLVPDGAFGFLPDRECAQIWVQLQAFIESCVGTQLSLSGFSSDIEKCFNNVGRDPLFALATHLGFPASITKPWRCFLDRCERAFVLRNAHSKPLSSSHGLPEGCALSVIGMVLIDWAYHVYMRALTPSVHAFSYVDNISVAGSEPLAVVAAFFSTVCFFQLWGLPLDYEKSFCWGTTTSSRAILKPLGLALCTDAKELGGCMTYGRARRNRHLKAKGHALQQKWHRLRRSHCPQTYKLSILPTVFWAGALHGCAACPVAKQYLAELRQAAIKALGFNSAGSNGLLRLSLAPKMLAHPGFYQVWNTLQTFRRICVKSGRILECWRLWWFSDSAKDSQGPFGQMLEMLSILGWTLLHPPMIRDHGGLVHHLLLMDEKLLSRLAQDAWLQHVAATACTRASMATVQGLDFHILLECNSTLTAHEWSLQSALQSGSFIDKWQHGRYDVTQARVCKFCLVPDTHDHVLVCSRFANLRAQLGLTAAELTSWPRHFALHLLCSRSPYVDALRHYFEHLEDVTADFSSVPADLGVQHLFTDGSCFAVGREELHQGAWAVFNATSGYPISGGPLPGLPQTIGRAELMAVISALRWSNYFRQTVHLWIDAQHIHQGLQARIHGHTTSTGEANSDLWFVVDQLLADGALARVSSTWVPSHLSVDLCTSPFEEWVAVNNDAADRLAVRLNQERPLRAQVLMDQQRDWDHLWEHRLGALRKYYFCVFAETRSSPSEPLAMLIDSSEDEGTLYSFSSFLSIDVASLDLPVSDLAGFPLRFVQTVLDWICRHETLGGNAKQFSFLELTVGLLFCDPIDWPHQSPSGQWQWGPHGTQFERPTLCYYLRLVRPLMLAVFAFCCSGQPLIRGINRSELGITLPLEGFSAAFPSDFLSEIRSHIRRFTCNRPVRRAGDLARPI